VQLRGAGDRDDPRLLREQPRERDLGRRRMVPPGDRLLNLLASWAATPDAQTTS